MSNQSIIERLSEALNGYEWTLCQKICDDLIAELNVSITAYPEPDAKKILNLLRRKRRYALMVRVADAFIRTGQVGSPIVRLYAQAMIDQGNLTAPQLVLKSIINDTEADPEEKAEAAGLRGRIYKQLYVNANSPGNPRQQGDLRQAMALYYDVYRSNPEQHFWHGINAVALLARAERDQVAMENYPSTEEIARQIDASLKKLAAPKYWDHATAAENAIALKDWDSAWAHAIKFVRDDEVDAFEVASLLRQLTEVWSLSAQSEPGDVLLPILKAALLRREGGCVTVEANNIGAEVNQAGYSKKQMEKVFGSDRYQTLDWYRTGLQRCAAVGRVETVLGKRLGTGFLVRAADFFAGHDPSELVLLTNAHVISPVDAPFPGAIPPEVARVVFEATGQTYPVAGLLWSSSPDNLDVSFVSLGAVKNPELCPLIPTPDAFDRSRQQRVYVIGYPFGGGLSVSLQDSIWLDTDDRLLHYRTPTEPGSSGSPVFDEQFWSVIAIHHAGEKNIPRLNGEPGAYDANEGISIAAIRKQTLGSGQSAGAAAE